MTRRALMIPLALCLTVLIGGCRPAANTEAPPPDPQPPAHATPDATADVAASTDGWSCVVGDGMHLLAIPAAGGDPRTLFTYAEEPYYRQASVSPDGSRVALLDADQSLHVVSIGDGVAEEIAGALEGGAVRRAAPQFSPDSQWLAWIEDGDLRLRDLEGTVAQITQLGQGGHFAWSPDSQYLAVCLRDEQERGQGLWIVHRSGGDVVQVAPASNDIYAASFPAYSPDGQTIAFSRAWEGGMLCFASAVGEAERLDLGPAFGTLHWLGDSSGVLYDAAANEVETGGIFFCARDADPMPVVEVTALGFDASAAGDLAFVIGDEAPVTISVIEDATGERRSLPERALPLQWARCAWRPDGEAIAAWSEGDEDAALFVGGHEGEFREIFTGVHTFVGWAQQQ